MGKDGKGWKGKGKGKGWDGCRRDGKECRREGNPDKKNVFCRLMFLPRGFFLVLFFPKKRGNGIGFSWVSGGFPSMQMQMQSDAMQSDAMQSDVMQSDAMQFDVTAMHHARS